MVIETLVVVCFCGAYWCLNSADVVEVVAVETVVCVAVVKLWLSRR